MGRRNKTLIDNRQWQFYNYLTQCFNENPGRWVSQEEINQNVTGYIWNPRAYDKCPGIRADKIALNASMEVDQLIVMKDRKFKIGTKSEVLEERKKHQKKLIRQAMEIAAFNQKYKLDGQFKLLDNRGNEMTDFAKPYRVTFTATAENNSLSK